MSVRAMPTSSSKYCGWPRNQAAAFKFRWRCATAADNPASRKKTNDTDERAVEAGPERVVDWIVISLTRKV